MMLIPFVLWTDWSLLVYYEMYVIPEIIILAVIVIKYNNENNDDICCLNT